MSDIKLIIFDLDGTIADTSPGIYECHRYANFQMRGVIPSNEELGGIIGGPLLKAYTDRFAFPEDEAKRAVEIYREHYVVEGIKGAVLYPGMADTLKKLKNSGYLTAVATLKAETLAQAMLAKLEISQYFDVIHGMDVYDSLTKSDLIRMCLNELNCSYKQSVLVGDSEHDAKGAIEARVRFIGCTYGFGFRCKSDAELYAPLGVISEPKELFDVLI